MVCVKGEEPGTWGGGWKELTSKKRVRGFLTCSSAHRALWSYYSKVDFGPGPRIMKLFSNRYMVAFPTLEGATVDNAFVMINWFVSGPRQSYRTVYLHTSGSLCMFLSSWGTLWLLNSCSSFLNHVLCHYVCPHPQTRIIPSSFSRCILHPSLLQHVPHCFTIVHIVL